jgi:hypothetical protein
MNHIHASMITAGLALVFACGPSPAPTSAAVQEPASPAEPPQQTQQPQHPVQTNELGDGLFAHIKTNKGEIICELAYKDAPLTVANFVGLATGKQHNTAKPDGTPYYDGLIFHRVIPGFMIQGGDPSGSGAGGPGYSFADEVDPSTPSY